MAVAMSSRAPAVSATTTAESASITPSPEAVAGAAAAAVPSVYAILGTRLQEIMGGSTVSAWLWPEWGSQDREHVEAMTPDKKVA